VFVAADQRAGDADEQQCGEEDHDRGGDGADEAVEVSADPTLYRFYEALGVYGPTLRVLLHEEFGDGIMSAINFSIDVRRVPTPAVIASRWCSTASSSSTSGNKSSTSTPARAAVPRSRSASTRRFNWPAVEAAPTSPAVSGGGVGEMSAGMTAAAGSHAFSPKNVTR